MEVVVEKRKRLEEVVEVHDGKKVKKGSKKSSHEEVEKKKNTTSSGVHHDDDEDEGEVEEFFAILRRIHVAVKYFEKDHGGDKNMAKLWNPNFEQQDFEGIKVGKGRSSETVEDNAGLDLNAVPIIDE